MKLVPAIAPRGDQTGRLEDVEVLGYRLPCQAEPVLHGQAGADLEQGLSVTFDELVEDHPPRRVGDGAVNIGHAQG